MCTENHETLVKSHFHLESHLNELEKTSTGSDMVDDEAGEDEGKKELFSS